jgi:hypothetical protein
MTETRAWLPILLASLVAILATLLSNASASTATTVGAETRVRASAVAVEVLVEPPERIGAVQRLGIEPARVVDVVGTGVAANTGGSRHAPTSCQACWTRSLATVERQLFSGLDKGGMYWLAVDVISVPPSGPLP